MENFDLTSFGGMVAAIIVLTELIDRKWHLQGVAAQVRSLFVAVVLSAILSMMRLFMFSDPLVCGDATWYTCGALVGLGAGLAANFAFLLPIVPKVLEILKIRVPAPTAQKSAQ